MLSATAIKANAREIGFDLCGIAPVGDHPELTFFRQWLDRGYAGEMAYLERSADRRADVRRVLPSARTVIVTGTISAPTSRGTPGATITTTSSATG
jgi:epoxyqueuosine reductase